VIRIRKNGLIKKVIVFAAISASVASAGAQTGTAEKRAHTPPLVLTGAIPLANTQGRIDHLGVDSKGRLFVSALGNNSEEASTWGLQGSPAASVFPGRKASFTLPHPTSSLSVATKASCTSTTIPWNSSLPSILETTSTIFATTPRTSLSTLHTATMMLALSPSSTPRPTSVCSGNITGSASGVFSTGNRGSQHLRQSPGPEANRGHQSRHPRHHKMALAGGKQLSHGARRGRAHAFRVTHAPRCCWPSTPRPANKWPLCPPCRTPTMYFSMPPASARTSPAAKAPSTCFSGLTQPL